jgi:hypothetical protein
VRSRTPTGPALALALALGLGATVSGAAVASDEPPIDKLTAEFGASAATEGLAVVPDAAVAPEAPTLALGLADDTAEWDTFRDLNLGRLDSGANPVIRNGALNHVATAWLSTQISTSAPTLDADVESKIPPGSSGGVQLLYWLRNGTDADMAEFLEWVAGELAFDAGSATLTDCGIAVAQSPFGLIAYYIVAGYPHSTPGAGEIPLYRFYKPAAGTHFYSTSAAERNRVIGTSEYRYEGLVAYIKSPSATSTTTPLRDLNRFYLPSAGTHFYTASPAEYAAVRTYPQYSLDGVAGRVFAARGPGLSAMHRFYRPASGTHFYTASAAEVETVKAIPGYVYEGLAFWLRVAS